MQFQSFIHSFIHSVSHSFTTSSLHLFMYSSINLGPLSKEQNIKLRNDYEQKPNKTQKEKFSKEKGVKGKVSFYYPILNQILTSYVKRGMVSKYIWLKTCKNRFIFQVHAYMM